MFLGHIDAIADGGPPRPNGADPVSTITLHRDYLTPSTDEVLEAEVKREAARVVDEVPHPVGPAVVETAPPPTARTIPHGAAASVHEGMPQAANLIFVLTHPSSADELIARSAAAAAALPSQPTPIDERIADALCQGQFDIPPPTSPLPPMWVGERVEPPFQPTWSNSGGSSVPTPATVAWSLAGAARSDRWFCVSQGSSPGVYGSWEEASPLVTGISRSVYSRYATKEEALRVYTEAYNRGGVVRR